MPCFYCGHLNSARSRAQVARQPIPFVCACCLSHDQAIEQFVGNLKAWEYSKRRCAIRYLNSRYAKHPQSLISNVIKRLVRQANLGNDLPDDFILFTPLR